MSYPAVIGGCRNVFFGFARQPVQHVKAAKLALPNSHEMRISRMNLPRLAWVFTLFFNHYHLQHVMEFVVENKNIIVNVLLS